MRLRRALSFALCAGALGCAASGPEPAAASGTGPISNASPEPAAATALQPGPAPTLEPPPPVEPPPPADPPPPVEPPASDDSGAAARVAAPSDSADPDATLHAAPTNGELPPPGAYFAIRDLDRRRPKNSVLEIYYEDGNVERRRRSEWRLRCKLDSAGVRSAKAAISASGVLSAKSTQRDPTIRDGGSLTHFFRLKGARGEVRNPNFPALHIDAMKRASQGLAQVIRAACPSS